MSSKSASIAVAVILIVVILILLIAYSYYPSSYSYYTTTPVADVKVAQQAASRRQREKSSLLSASPDQELNRAWKKWAGRDAARPDAAGVGEQ